ncbi:MAG: tRNA (adenosine(37)-N6)-dimethylallyltransferase MiaA [Candidatus Sericytochromatia bacterium]|nr:tRNA (adenosine(37)-N6)-dimethylallyltransferase MiaA [Candidatus Sericytochromatia bacterium]
MSPKTAQEVLVLSGPTASGKSALALALAEAWPVTILSADSRQVYRGFDIGTAKPSREERDRVPHRLIDVADPDDRYTAAHWVADAKACLEEAWNAGRLPVVTGGTGFWIRALLGGTPIAPVPPDPEMRDRLMAMPDLHARLAEVDPVSARALHPNDRFRLARALEIALATGKPRGATPTPSHGWRVLHLTLVPDRTKLREAIERRTTAMNESGWGAEVQALIERHGTDLPLLDTLGYREWRDVLVHGRDAAEARASIVVRTCQFARRQASWFRHEPEAVPLSAEAGEPRNTLVQRVITMCEAWRA